NLHSSPYLLLIHAPHYDGWCGASRRLTLIKRVTFVRFRSDVPRGEAVRRWTTMHAAIARLGRGVRRYRINVYPRGEGDGWDGFAEMWFREDADPAAAFDDI